jgi:hypothetical protein
MPLIYHQATFELMGTKPQTSKPALKVLAERERLLGITLPASLREFYSLKGASAILEQHSDQDPAVPIEELGGREEVAHGVLKIQVENQGVVAWYVRLDDSDDPPVEVEVEYLRCEPAGEGEEEASWDPAGFRRVADRFSEYVHGRVLTHRGGRQDRRAAARLKPYGGHVQFDGGGRAVELSVSGRIVGKGGIRPAKPLDVAAMAMIRQLDRLVKLDLDVEEVDPAGWPELGGHPSLAVLHDRGALDDAAVEHLGGMHTLREVSLVANRLTDVGLLRLLRGHPLAALDIRMGRLLTPRGLAALEAQAGIERLGLERGEAAPTDVGLAGLAGLVSLRELYINSPQVTDDGLRHLAGLSRLERLNLYLDAMTDSGLVHLAGLWSLKFLRLWYSESISGAGFRHLAGLRELQVLDAGGLPIVDEALVHLGGLTDLEELILRETRVVGPGLRFLSGLAKLRKLDLRGDELVDEGLSHLAAAAPPRLECLDIAYTRITDAGLRALAPLQSLRDLDLSNVAVSAEAVRDLQAAIPSLTQVSGK